MRELTEADKERIERNRQAALRRRLARTSQTPTPEFNAETLEPEACRASTADDPTPATSAPQPGGGASCPGASGQQPSGTPESDIPPSSSLTSIGCPPPSTPSAGPLRTCSKWLHPLPPPGQLLAVDSPDAAAGAAISSAAVTAGPPGGIQSEDSCRGSGAPPACGQVAPPALSLGWPPRQLFDFFVVVDFESTCDEKRDLHPQEIIEFPSVLVNARTLRIEDTWREYVRPAVHSTLTPFCTRFTGIQQCQVDAGRPLAEVLCAHDRWLRENGVLDAAFAVVTWSDWDCKVMLEMECKWKNIRKPAYFNRWINLKVAFEAGHLRREASGLRGAVEAAGLTWQGRPHSGLDDARNTARLALALIARGAVLSISDSFSIYGPDGARTSGTALSRPRRAPPGAEGRLRQVALDGPRVVAGGGGAGGNRKRAAAAAAGGRCLCGVRSKRRSVKKPGPTHGRVFFSCGKWTITTGGTCDYFEWAAQSPLSGNPDSGTPL